MHPALEQQDHLSWPPPGPYFTNPSGLPGVYQHCYLASQMSWCYRFTGRLALGEKSGFWGRSLSGLRHSSGIGPLLISWVLLPEVHCIPTPGCQALACPRGLWAPWPPGSCPVWALGLCPLSLCCPILHPPTRKSPPSEVLGFLHQTAHWASGPGSALCWVSLHTVVASNPPFTATSGPLA